MRDKERPGRHSPAVVNKEKKIKEFILDFLTNNYHEQAADAAEILLIARSPDSPVARAVASVAAMQHQPISPADHFRHNNPLLTQKPPTSPHRRDRIHELRRCNWLGQRQLETYGCA